MGRSIAHLFISSAEEDRYPCMVQFDETNSACFFGREQDVRELIKRLRGIRAIKQSKL